MINQPTLEELAVLPPLYSTENVYHLDKEVLMHFYVGVFDFFAVEFDGKDTFFGFSSNGDVACSEWGYMSFSQLLNTDLTNTGGMEIIRNIVWQPTLAQDILVIQKWAEWLNLKPVAGESLQQKRDFDSIIEMYVRQEETFQKNAEIYRSEFSIIACELAKAASPFVVGEKIADDFVVESIQPVFDMETAGLIFPACLYHMVIFKRDEKGRTARIEILESGIRKYEDAGAKRSFSVKDIIGYGSGVKYNICRRLYGQLLSVSEKYNEEKNNQKALAQQILVNYCPFKEGQDIEVPISFMKTHKAIPLVRIHKIEIATLDEIKKDGMVYQLITSAKRYCGREELAVIENLNNVSSVQYQNKWGKEGQHAYF